VICVFRTENRPSTEPDRVIWREERATQRWAEILNQRVADLVKKAAERELTVIFGSVMLSARLVGVCSISPCEECFSRMGQSHRAFAFGDW
jgi:hypothetical protein